MSANQVLAWSQNCNKVYKSRYYSYKYSCTSYPTLTTNYYNDTFQQQIAGWEPYTNVSLSGYNTSGLLFNSSICFNQAEYQGNTIPLPICNVDPV